MKEQFDKKLRDHIKDTFDVFDDGLADDGWKKFQQKERRKKIIAYLTWTVPSGIAAAIAMFFVLNASIKTPTTNQTDLNIANNRTIEQKTIKESPVKALLSEKKFLNNNSVKKIAKNLDINNTKNIINTAYKKNLSKNLNNDILNDNSLELGKTALAIINEDNLENTTPTTAIPTTAINKEIIEENKTPKEKLSFAEFLAQNSEENNIKESSIMSKKDKKASISVDASSFVNFSDNGFQDKMNVSIGINSDYKIAKNLSISTGVNFNKQNTIYDNHIYATSSNVNALNSPTVLPDNLSKVMASAVATVAKNEISNARFVGLDIPINLKLNGKTNNLNWYVAGGLGSYALLNEKYSNTYSLVNYSSLDVKEEKITSVEESSVNSFMFARTLNLSVGFQVPLKNMSTFFVEPFVKYPIRSMGQQDISVGSGGINLKMNLDKKLFKH